jgi:lambda family phage tail tape measure protein
MANHQNAATLGVALSLETGDFVTQANKVAYETQKMKNAIAREMKAADKEIQALKYATEDYGKAVTKVSEIERQLATGRLKDIKGTDKAKELLAQAAAYDKVAAAAKNAMGAQFKMNEQQKIQLTYQTTDLFTQIASGQSPFIAILQQGGQLKDVMGGLGNMFRALGSLITPFSVGMTVAAVAIGATAKAAYDAATEMEQLKDALTLTGNYSGVTDKSFQKLAETLSGTTKASLGTTKEALMAVISSGQFTGQSINAVTQAIINYSQIAGISATEAAQKLKGGLSGTAEGAKSLNNEMNFLTLEQYKQIEALEKANKKQEAAQVVAVALNTKLQQQRRELGLLEGAWKSVTTSMSNYWDKFKELLSGPTQSQTLDSLDKQISDIKQKLSGTSEEEDTVFARGWRKTLASLQASKENLLEIQRLQARSATSKDVGNSKAGIGEYDQYKGMLASKAAEVEKAKMDAAFVMAKQGANEIEKLEIDSAKKIVDAYQEMQEKNRQENGRATTQNLEIYKSKVLAAEKELSEKKRQIAARDRIATNNAQAEEEQKLKDMDTEFFKMKSSAEWAAKEKTKSIEFQQEEFRLKNDMLYATEKEMKLAQLALEYKRKRAEPGAAGEVGQRELDRQEALEKFNIEIQDSMKKTGQVFESVWGNLGAAIDKFVQTGKFKMKDFAASVIRDLIAIEMKAQASTLLRGVFKSFIGSFNGGGFGTGNAYGNMDLGGFFADGGDPPVGKASVVGERGPELFVPRTAGTIIPNNALGGMGGQTINYNGPIIQNMNAIDTQSGLQFLAKNKQGVFAAYQSANRSIPTSR